MGVQIGDDWAAIRRAFDGLVELEDTARAERLAQLPGTLHAELSSLLDAEAAAGVLDRSLQAHDAPAAADGLAPGTIVGNFTIDRPIGRGGMGEVYAAHRSDLDQRVALKLLRPGPPERALLFDRERRLLAGLEHPGISRLIDGGVTADGRPWMAMEYVEGEPIDRWCAARAAGLRERLRLFLEACDAVAHAHAALIVHCDLKPANILVDARGRVRLLDFGIARLVDDGGAAGAQGTPDYAAPEQLARAAPAVAADIYALGAVLFELLTGIGPWATGGTAPSLIKRLLRDEPPSAASVARAGGPVPQRLIAGDLDAIVVKALRHDPALRYGSVAGLAADVKRYLEHRPVQARGGGAIYVARRFVQRAPWGVAAGVAALLAAAAGVGGVVLQSQRTAVERDVALAEVRRSDAINRMVTVVFRDARDRGGSDDATVKQTLDATAGRLVGTLDRSSQSAALVDAIGDLYIHLEDPAGAEALLDKALAAGIGRGDPVATAGTRMRLGAVKAALGKSSEAAALLDAAAAVFERDPERYGSERLQIVATRASLARGRGDHDTAVRLLAGSMADAERIFAGDHRELLTRHNNILVYLAEANRLDEMPAWFARTDAALKRTGEEESVFALAAMQAKGAYLLKREDLAGAAAIFARVIALRRARFGASAGLAVDLLQLGRVELKRGRAAAAEPLLAEALALATANIGATAPPTLMIAMSLAEAEAELERTGDAERRLAAVAAAAPKGMFAAILDRTRAVVLFKQGRRDEALAALARAAAGFGAGGPAGVPYLKTVAPLRARITAATD